MIEQHFFVFTFFSCFLFCTLSLILFFLDPSDTVYTFFPSSIDDFNTLLYYLWCGVLFFIVTFLYFNVKLFRILMNCQTSKHAIANCSLVSIVFVFLYVYVLCTFILLLFLDVCDKYTVQCTFFLPIKLNMACISIEKHYQVLNYSIVI